MPKLWMRLASAEGEVASVLFGPITPSDQAPSLFLKSEAKKKQRHPGQKEKDSHTHGFSFKQKSFQTGETSHSITRDTTFWVAGSVKENR
jgi:hypothetical protein